MKKYNTIATQAEIKFETINPYQALAEQASETKESSVVTNNKLLQSAEANKTTAKYKVKKDLRYSVPYPLQRRPSYKTNYLMVYTTESALKDRIKGSLNNSPAANPSSDYNVKTPSVAQDTPKPINLNKTFKIDKVQI